MTSTKQQAQSPLIWRDLFPRVSGRINLSFGLRSYDQGQMWELWNLRLIQFGGEPSHQKAGTLTQTFTAAVHSNKLDPSGIRATQLKILCCYWWRRKLSEIQLIMMWCCGRRGSYHILQSQDVVSLIWSGKIWVETSCTLPSTQCTSGHLCSIDLEPENELLGAVLARQKGGSRSQRPHIQHMQGVVAKHISKSW